MLKSEKIDAGPLMSFGGATRRMFQVRPTWLRLAVMPWVYIIWVLCVCPLYYIGGWMFFSHGVRRRRLAEQQRHRELVHAQLAAAGIPRGNPTETVIRGL